MAAKKATGHLLSKLRDILKSKKYCNDVISAYIIPTADAHQSEYVASCDKRREFISGFTGSAGTAMVTPDHALLWTDGRYHLQAESQVDENWTVMKFGLPDVPKLEEWLSTSLEAGSVVAVDPFVISSTYYETIRETLTCNSLVLVPIQTNLVDLVWESEGGCPQRPVTPIFVLPMKYSGRGWEDKVAGVREKMKEKKAKGLVVTALDEIAWLLNLRGKDVEFNPVFFSYIIVTLDNIQLFINKEKLTEDVKNHLKVSEDGGVSLFGYEEIGKHVQELVKNQAEGKIWIDKVSSQALSGLVPKTQLVKEMSPIQEMKAVKNATEIQGMKNAHMRDAVALCQYLCWLEGEVPRGTVTEISGADKLEGFRREASEFVDLSFATISSSGPNGAVIHYRPTPATDRKLCSDEMYLVDSGAQYWDGTTDVTRTVHFGSPTQFQRECFTRVLKGHIALSTAVFPSKTDGHRIEVLARAPLWSAGLNYLHGTGHGVGHFLNVHEGPCGINSRPSRGPLLAGMFLSDEPGYYDDGSFGIRHENVVLIEEAATPHRYKNEQYLTMEPVTMVPYQQKMILPELLTPLEIEWLNEYHTKCWEQLGPLLREKGNMKAYQWLQRQTRLLG